MPKKFDYTRNARRFVARWPVFTFVLSQVVFWIVAYVFLAIIAHMVLLTAGPALHAEINLNMSLVVAVFFGFFYGLVSGYAGWFFGRKVFYKKPLWIVTIGKAVIAIVIFVTLISLVRSALYPYLHERYFSNVDMVRLDRSWEIFFDLLLVYTIAIGLLINFINQVNRKYGPGVLIPILLGRYRKPKEEERIFLFMDLKSSTSIAEALGHLKYSAFIRDSFMDINSVLAAYNAQIYQYAGDEIVITWTIEEGMQDFSCIRFFFACEEKFKQNAPGYMDAYGRVPEFKAGLHMGKVTAVEVGDIKRDIAYHGDTLNTAARIQSVCNTYNKKLLTSAYIWENTEVGRYYTMESLGAIELKGKSNRVEIASLRELTI
ncbi:MAG TPA: adenylate/guanylate cyclase domain-containing protein [Chryseolinea sp.]|nr:adenylate/guanylate cyclase domain-containing protein [Chryseolinea sp.]